MKQTTRSILLNTTALLATGILTLGLLTGCGGSSSGGEEQNTTTQAPSVTFTKAELTSGYDCYLSFDAQDADRFRIVVAKSEPFPNTELYSGEYTLTGIDLECVVGENIGVENTFRCGNLAVGNRLVTYGANQDGYAYVVAYTFNGDALMEETIRYVVPDNEIVAMRYGYQYSKNNGASWSEPIFYDHDWGYYGAIN